MDLTVHRFWSYGKANIDRVGVNSMPNSVNETTLNRRAGKYDNEQTSRAFSLVSKTTIRFIAAFDILKCVDDV